MLQAEQLLTLVEAARQLDCAHRGILLWQAVASETPAEALWEAPVGCRDRALLELHFAQFGQLLELGETCPNCGQEVEFSVDGGALRLPTPNLDNAAFPVEVAGRSLMVRRVSCLDLAVVAQDPNSDLLKRCVVSTCGADVSARGNPEGDPGATDLGDAKRINEQERSVIDAALAAADPQADIRFDMGCPACEHQWSSLFDIGDILWSSLERCVSRLLIEVDVLARVYHWSEREILQLPASRRRRYLELVTS